METIPGQIQEVIDGQLVRSAPASSEVRLCLSIPVPSVSRQVHYVLPLNPDLRPNAVGEHRPATIIRVWSENDPDSAVQLAVLIDGKNDQESYQGKILWATSVRHDEVKKEPGTWHWPEYVPNIIQEVPTTDEGQNG